MNDLKILAEKLAKAKPGMRWGYTVPKIHPALTVEERDLLVQVLIEAQQHAITTISKG